MRDGCCLSMIEKTELVSLAATITTKNNEMAMSRELSNRMKMSTGGNLEIMGVGFQFTENDYEPSITGSNYMDLKRNVIDEVLILIARLVEDRRRTEIQHEEEKQNVFHLTKKLDKLGLRRNHDLPVLVQREHETCITDITELEWHIAYHSQTLKKLSHKVEIEEKFCNQLKKEIDEMSSKVPLIDEKCALELKSIDGILTVKADTTVMLESATEINRDTLERNKEAHAKADKEIAEMKYDLELCTKELKKSK
jgi:hypothetical protein